MLGLYERGEDKTEECVTRETQTKKTRSIGPRHDQPHAVHFDPNLKIDFLELVSLFSKPSL